jgi:hypothetical protein
VNLPLSVCRPPHVIVSAARNFAIFSNEFVVVPPRQIGIISTKKDVHFLKALALFLSSDFARYHEFLTASQLGVQRFVSTLSSVRELPVPLADAQDIAAFAELHDRLVKIKPEKLGETAVDGDEFNFGDREVSEDSAPLLRELNERVAAALGLTKREQDLVRSLVETRIYLNDGNVGEPAVRPPDDADLKAYSRALKEDMDGFLGLASKNGHSIAVIKIGQAALVRITLPRVDIAKATIRISNDLTTETAEIAATFATLQKQHPQWAYFRRALRCYSGEDTYLLKPLQRFQWTVAQATMDAASLIADHLSTTSER